jgi:hypothetical protein
MNGSRLLRQTTDRNCGTFKFMKTKKLAEVLERVEAWPPEAQNELADIALELDAELSNGDSRSRALRAIAEIGKRRYESIRENLERDHFGAHVMINTDTSDYIVAPTISQVHTAFVERFGEDAPCWTTRIGISIFAVDAIRFDAAIGRDARAGKLDGLAEEALAAHRAGGSREL